MKWVQVRGRHNINEITGDLNSVLPIIKEYDFAMLDSARRIFVLNSQKVGKALVEHLNKSKNVTLLTNQEIKEFETKDRKIVAVVNQHGERMEADEFVVSAQNDSGPLLK
jgi:2-polyprenyl-6-methoxyphenol hydroxylase-like FAD-dependent oxidoreductase